MSSCRPMNGSLILPSLTVGSIACGANGGIVSSIAVICTGPNAVLPIYPLTGPPSFDGSVLTPASTISGITTAFAGSAGQFIIDNAYVSGTPIVSSAIFNDTTLDGLRFTPGLQGLIGTWQLDGTPGPDGQIDVVLGPFSAPATAVPGPLPLFGAAAAFGWSRKLRRRLATATPTTAG